MKTRCAARNTLMTEVTLVIAAIIALLLVAIVAFPCVASAWLLNLANADIARAAALPEDSPHRVAALADAAARLNQTDHATRRAALARARLLLLRGDPQRAADAMRGSGSGWQNDPIAQFVWADAEWQSANPSSAFEHWRAGGAFTFFINAANRARIAEHWTDAALLARIAVGIAPDAKRAEAHYVLADALAGLPANDSEAMRELERAIELTRDPELLATILSRKGELLAAQGNHPAALELFDQAMKIAPLDARPRTDYARTLLQFQPAARDRAVELLQQSIGLAPWYSLAYVTLAETAESEGETRSRVAEEWYKKGLAQNRNNPDLLFRLGQFYARRNRLAEAEAHLVLALRYETRGKVLSQIARELERLSAR